jgi:enoyl-CoA hydratase/carnithine racemase
VIDTRFDAISTRQEGRVMFVTLDNAPVNALSAYAMRELHQLLSSVRADESIAVIVFESANTEFFIAHADMNLGEQMDVLGELASQTPEGVNVFQAVGELLRNQPQVTIVKLAGIARGGGAEFVAAADMTFAARETARLGQIESLMGIVPAGGGTQYLAERVGRNRALELVLTGDAVDADTAALYGWINRAMPATELDAFVDQLAHNISNLAPGVMAATKRILAPVTPVEGYEREEAEWSTLIGQSTAGALMGGSLRRGAQTPDGERDLEGLLRQIGQETTSI